MITVDQIASKLWELWGTKTLEELRLKAEKEANGTAFECIRNDLGQRFILVMCLTDLDQIAILEKVLNLVDDNRAEDWNKVTVADLVLRTIRGLGLAHESLKDEYGRRSALLLIATKPEPMRMVETIFELPK